MRHYLGLAKSTYYYKPSQGKAGRKASSTVLVAGAPVSNEAVLEALTKEYIGQEHLDCGYRKLAMVARSKGITMNHKKLYRLVKEAKLLKQRIARPVIKKALSPHRKPRPQAPLECIEMDFKYIYCPHKRQNVYLLTILDVFTRRILTHSIDTRMKRNRVIELMDRFRQEYPTVDQTILRTDNGCQFTSNQVAQYLLDKGVRHEFTRPATPQENGHIEAWHATLEREYLRRNSLYTFQEIQTGVKAFIEVYNNKRLHSSLNYLTPEQFYQNWLSQHTSLKAEGSQRTLPAESQSSFFPTQV